MEKNKTAKKLLLGQVISDKMDKTIVVKVLRTFKHPMFGKVLKDAKHYKVHDEKGDAKVGDVVEFFEGRPLSKTKCRYLHRIVERQTV